MFGQVSGAGEEARQVFETVEDAGYFRTLVPELAVAAQTRFDATHREGGPATAGAAGVKGYLARPGVVSTERARAMVRAVHALHAAGLPTVFAYVYDAFWEPLAEVRLLAEAELGPCDVLADVWAFRVEPSSRGWTAHRGLSEFEGDRVMLNVWLALTHATVDTSCMFIVPLDRDPAYPGELSSIRVPEGEAVALEALPGTALAWDANALHWGGEMSALATEPRVSATYTLRRSDRRRADLPVLDLGALDFRRRLDLIAGELTKYAEMTKVAPAMLEWARLTLLTREMAARL